MRLPTRVSVHICLPWQRATGRQLVATNTSRPARYLQRSVSSTTIPSEDKDSSDSVVQASAAPGVLPTTFDGLPRQERRKKQNKPSSSSQEADLSSSTLQTGNQTVPYVPSFTKDVTSQPTLRSHGTSTSPAIELSEAQQYEIREACALRQRLSEGLQNVDSIKQDSSGTDGIQIDQLLSLLPQEGRSVIQQKLIQRFGSHFGGQPFGKIQQDLDLAARHGDPARRKVTDPKAKEVLVQLGVIDGPLTPALHARSIKKGETLPINDETSIHSSGRGRLRRPLASLVTSKQPAKKGPQKESAQSSLKQPTSSLPKAETQTVEAQDLKLTSIAPSNIADLPRLSFDLSRVLFNPGTVYHLQDPRSRVYNFDPYLEKLVPMSDFNYEALNPYLTSSEDDRLLKLAREHEKRYVGSSSSMTAVLAQFHFLISQWRELNTDNFTRGFSDPSRTFTMINRSPAAIFLRYKDGVYAVDGDKEFDEPNVLMSLGKSMEKLLTLEKDKFEKWRKSNATADSPLVESTPDVFHYAQQGRFLMRSQLDAYDPRLPGNGYFDLKTRAVAAVRFNIRNHEAGMGYEIKERHGSWETYEREYYDMMRSTFLKYSLQARMGHMDGIFVAYHNTARIFGFQYIPMSEMDLALHGQQDLSLGDQEFQFSVNFMEEIFNLGTSTYPGQSLRIHFDAREPSVTEEKPFMNIFLEPMAEDDIKAIQNSQKAQFEAFERKLLRGEDPTPVLEGEIELDDAAEDASGESMSETKEEQSDDSQLAKETVSSPSTPLPSTAANKEFLESILNTPRARSKSPPFEKDVIGLKLTVQNKINGRAVHRVSDITSASNWSIDYKLERRSDEEAKRMYRLCKNRRTSALRSAINRSSDDPYVRSIRALSEKGAEWRKQQDELDAQREQVVLYKDRLPQ